MKRISLLLAIAAMHFSGVSICSENELLTTPYIPTNHFFGTLDGMKLQALNSNNNQQIFNTALNFEDTAKPALLVEKDNAFFLHTPVNPLMPIENLTKDNVEKLIPQGVSVPNDINRSITPSFATDSNGNKYEITKKVIAQSVELLNAQRKPKEISKSTFYKNTKLTIFPNQTMEAHLLNGKYTMQFDDFGILLTPEQRKSIVEKDPNQSLFIYATNQQSEEAIFEISTVEIHQPSRLEKFILNYPKAAKATFFAGVGMAAIFAAAVWRLSGAALKTNWLGVVSNKLFGTNYSTILYQ